MQSFTRAALAAALTLAAAAPAMAQERPANIFPTRDVVLNYRLLGAAPPQGARRAAGPRRRSAWPTSPPSGSCGWT
ncbi:hypothetical protein ACE7GA_10240 [Roseomonas sp. CCTCC AB2023176]|uniref:hypothetical protein n=1 Tax=Roseomonas sp. CCTCC AB2023176 TaxID=3342640 RepID=UPI0035DBF7FB